MINLIKKYLFASLVVVYVITAAGVPVYLHYCGGELEKINYVMKGDSCCGDEEDDSESAANDCCKDENYILKSNADFTFQKFGEHNLVKAVNELLFVQVFYFPLIQNAESSFVASIDPAPPRAQDQMIIETSVIRI